MISVIGKKNALLKLFLLVFRDYYTVSNVTPSFFIKNWLFSVLRISLDKVIPLISLQIIIFPDDPCIFHSLFPQYTLHL